MRTEESDGEYFRNRVGIDSLNDPGCWIWLGTMNHGNGQGVARRNNRPYGAHRFVYELLIGPLPPTYNLLPTCGRKDCVNPAHRTLVPASEQRGGFARENILKTHCPRGHEYSEANTYSGWQGKRVCRECRRSMPRSARARPPELGTRLCYAPDCRRRAAPNGLCPAHAEYYLEAR